MVTRQRTARRLLAVACTAVALVLGALAWDGPAAAQSTPRPGTAVTGSAAKAVHYTPAGCAKPARPGAAVCFAKVWTAGTLHQIVADTTGPPANALGPSQIQAAYNLPAGGGGQTVAIVDAFGDSSAEQDLATFRAHYGLPACTTANGCFKKVDQTGGTNYPADDAGWALETSLDLDAVSAACPECNILLVEGDNSSTDSLGAAVRTAVSLGARYVSNSYGVPGEYSEETSDTNYQHKGVAVVASTGDTGNVVNWPASDPNVVAAGGTTLTADSSVPRGWQEAAWSAGGSGCSLYEPRPDYQLNVATACPNNRAIADISADADPASGLAVYDTLGQDGWLRVGGTSLSAPLIAAMYALAGPPDAGSYPVANLYNPSHVSQFNDITAGSNDSCGTVLCTAGRGWDGPTGVGTPAGVTGLRQGPHGDIAGTVSDASTGDPIVGAVVATSGGSATRTDASGHYDLSNLDVGSYNLTASAYRYGSRTQSSVMVLDGKTATVDLPLTPVPSTTVSGTVTDGSGHGWPVYAEINIDGYPNGPIFSDPKTGRYTVELPESATYTLHISPFYDGYQPLTQTISLGQVPLTKDIRPKADLSACTAGGYGWNGTSADFLGWSGATPREGWSLAGSASGWRFDDPGNRQPPPGGDNHFAIADSAYYSTARMSTVLTSTRIDLSTQPQPVLSFDSRYIGAPHQVGMVSLSTDNGKTWTTVWKRTTTVTSGTVNISLAAAAHRSGVRVRFAFTGQRGGYWAIDNVFIGTHQCVALNGGLVIGNVSDATTHSDIPGAHIYREADPMHPATSVATVDDPGTSDGLYWLFSPSGSQKLVTSRTGYITADRTVTVTANEVLSQDWSLTQP